MRKQSLLLAVILGLGILLLTGCNSSKDNPEETTEIANPASSYCEENQGTLFLEGDEEGNQTGLCMFEDGSYCEEWAYYRGECNPGEIMYNTVDNIIGMPNPAAVYCVENGGVLNPQMDENGEYSLCMFEDGSYCEEWAYYRGECNPGEIVYNTVSEEEVQIGMANPASVYCVEQGGEHYDIEDEEGNQIGMCRLSDGSEVDEWSYFRENNLEGNE